MQKKLEEQFAVARGGLQQVGGAVVRERHRDVQDALAAAQAQERELHREYDAWKLLLATLQESESTQGAHLGRALSARLPHSPHERRRLEPRHVEHQR